MINKYSIDILKKYLIFINSKLCVYVKWIKKTIRYQIYLLKMKINIIFIHFKRLIAKNL